ncbi:hypothetical protein DEH84_06885 [Aquabacterium olei]|uniref:Replication protein n=2 Tax=Aquabacterium olei TaxID=1296669 RepID=A0A2U8FS03_9BURK|nr:hypothetical protein DEH84_06885 [Aquabacterium olei]
MSVESVRTILATLQARYGNKFADLWRGVPPASLEAVWSEDLAGFTVAEIKRGLDACKHRDWPPTLPEFINLCRPAMDMERVFLEAQEGIRARDRGQPYKWTHPALYWAAVDFGASDLMRMTWREARHRWQLCMDKQGRRDTWPAIPAPPAGYLPPPEPKQAPAAVREQLRGLLQQMPRAPRKTTPAEMTNRVQQYQASNP